ncbi:MAG: hypothetical protein PVJ67_06670 [Candidatus Pacearchaeota archaeon]|jgi:hypothetical protein
MYKKIERQSYYGPADQQRVAKAVLQSLGVPGHSAAVYEQNHDTGYLGLCITSTIVDISLQDKGLAKKVNEALNHLGFNER